MRLRAFGLAIWIVSTVYLWANMLAGNSFYVADVWLKAFVLLYMALGFALALEKWGPRPLRWPTREWRKTIL